MEADSDSEPDVEFQCDGKSAKAHRLVVTARSPVLATMLQSQWVEGETGIIKIEDMDFDTLKLFLRYLYTGRLDGAMTFQLAVVLYEAADKYHVQGLARRCAQSLIEGLTVENSCEVLDVADRHSDAKFVEEVIVFMLEKKVPSTSGHWRAFCGSHPFLATVVLNRYVEEQNRYVEAQNRYVQEQNRYVEVQSRYIEELTGSSGLPLKRYRRNVSEE